MQKITYNLTVFWVLILLLTSCSSGGRGDVTRAFYYWQSGNTRNLEEHMFNESGATKMYVKLFEISLDNMEGAIPLDKSYMKLPTYLQKKVEIVPCIFIENDVIAKSTNDQLDELAENSMHLVNKYLEDKLRETKDIPIICNEIQIDCDWMASSKEAYFYFLKAMKKQTDKRLSCTLRLYPYKFTEEMGVPPVDRVMLLCYNLLNPRTNSNKNSILNLEEMKKYIQPAKEYPLPLDAALPTYSSCYIFSGGQFETVEHGIPEDLEGICAPSDDGLWYVVQQDTSLDYNYYRRGDRLRIERVSSEVLLAAAQLVIDNVTLDADATVSLYHLDENEIKHYTHETLDAVFVLFDQR